MSGLPDCNPKTAMGMKKPDPTVIPPAAILHLATAMMNGAEKYGPFNWRDQPISARTYVGAAMRHLLAYLDGEDYSQDTMEKGQPVHHLAHVMACCAIALDATSLGSINDNRPKVKGKSGDMIELFNSNGSFYTADEGVGNATQDIHVVGDAGEDGSYRALVDRLGDLIHRSVADAVRRRGRPSAR
jgi:hypothetical protein